MTEAEEPPPAAAASLRHDTIRQAIQEAIRRRAGTQWRVPQADAVADEAELGEIRTAEGFEEELGS